MGFPVAWTQETANMEARVATGIDPVAGEAVLQAFDDTQKPIYTVLMTNEDKPGSGNTALIPPEFSLSLILSPGTHVRGISVKTKEYILETEEIAPSPERISTRGNPDKKESSAKDSQKRKEKKDQKETQSEQEKKNTGREEEAEKSRHQIR